MTKRDWIAPGILLTVLTLSANFVSAWAVDRYRQDDTEKAIESLGDKIDKQAGELRSEIRQQGVDSERKFEKINDRLDKMGQSAEVMARLQERNSQLTDAIRDLRDDMRGGFKEMATQDEVIRMQAQKFREEVQRELYRRGGEN